MSDLAISLRSVVALIDRFPVLAGIDLDVTSGQVVLVEGSNGAGKTSLFRLLAGLLPLSTGSAQVLGYDLAQDRKSVRNLIGFMAHNPFLYDDLTARENVEFFTRISGVDVSRVDDCLGRFELSGRLAQTPTGRLSQGQRRRVGLAILLSRSSKLWLLDEPHAGLDRAARAQLDAVVDEVAAAGCTVIYSSHESQRSDSVDHRRVRIEGGQIIDEPVVDIQVKAGSNVG